MNYIVLVLYTYTTMILLVHNLRGNKLELNEYNYSGDIDPYLEVDFDISSTFINECENTKGCVYNAKCRN